MLPSTERAAYWFLKTIKPCGSRLQPTYYIRGWSISFRPSLRPILFFSAQLYAVHCTCNSVCTRVYTGCLKCVILWQCCQCTGRGGTRFRRARKNDNGYDDGVRCWPVDEELRLENSDLSVDNSRLWLMNCVRRTVERLFISYSRVGHGSGPSVDRVGSGRVQCQKYLIAYIFTRKKPIIRRL